MKTSLFQFSQRSRGGILVLWSTEKQTPPGLSDPKIPARRTVKIPVFHLLCLGSVPFLSKDIEGTGIWSLSGPNFPSRNSCKIYQLSAF